MPSLIDIRRRIRSVKNTQQITKAMKMVSAAKLRRAQDRVIAARPYAALLRQVLANVAAAAAHGRAGGRESAAGAAAGKAHRAGADHRRQRAGGRVQLEPDQGGAASSRPTIRTPDGISELVGRKGRDFFRKRGVDGGRRAHRPGGQSAITKMPPRSRRTLMERFAQRRDRRGLPDLQRIQERDGAEADGDARAAGGNAGAEQQPMDYIFEQPPAEMLGACCRAMWRWRSTARCWNRRRRNTRRA